MLLPKVVSAPVGWQSHFGQGNLGVFVEQFKEPRLPLTGQGDLLEPEVANGKHESDASIIECRVGMPLRVFVFTWNRRLCAEDAIPDPGMVGTRVAKGEKCFGPGEELLIGVSKLSSYLADYLTFDAEHQLEGRSTGHQFASHPERELLVLVTVMVTKMDDKLLPGAALLFFQSSQPLLMVRPLAPPKLRQRFQVTP